MKKKKKSFKEGTWLSFQRIHVSIITASSHCFVIGGTAMKKDLVTLVQVRLWSQT